MVSLFNDNGYWYRGRRCNCCREHADHNNVIETDDAAILGLHMAVPVVSSTLTTIAAFIPLFIISV